MSNQEEWYILGFDEHTSYLEQLKHVGTDIGIYLKR
jgi:hypothetical protein